MPSELLAACWSRTGVSCAGCGQPLPTDFGRLDAIAAAPLLPRRLASLLGHSDAELARRPQPRSRSALESAIEASDLLAAAVSHLRQLTGQDSEPAPPNWVRIETIPSGRNERGTMIVLSNLAGQAARLTRTIQDTTDHDWRRVQAPGGSSAAQQVWLALHNAVHHLEDAELHLANLSGTSETYHCGPAPSEQIARPPKVRVAQGPPRATQGGPALS